MWIFYFFFLCRQSWNHEQTEAKILLSKTKLEWVWRSSPTIHLYVHSGVVLPQVSKESQAWASSIVENGFSTVIPSAQYLYCLHPLFAHSPCCSCSPHGELHNQEPLQTPRPPQAWSSAVLSGRRNVSFPWETDRERAGNGSAPPAASHGLSHSKPCMFLKHHILGVDTFA